MSKQYFITTPTTFPPSKRNTRNSSIELLRVIAMFMILAHHFIVHNRFDIKDMPIGLEKVFFQTIMQGGGKVGVVIFFSISTWFLINEKQEIRNSLRRIWLMEREVLFWSILLASFFFIFDRTDLSRNLLLRSFVPLNMGVWWYATAYAIFLAILPFLQIGLKALGRHNHLALTIVILIIWGVRGFIPGMVSADGPISSGLNGILGFIYIFILISAYKWYLPPLSTKQIWALISIGFSFFILYTVASICLSLFGHNVGIYITGDWTLPVIMIGFGMFLLFERITIHSKLINRIAKSAFGVYLITDYGASENLLWKRWFNLEFFYHRPFAILQILGILLAIYIACTLLDFIRQGLFAITIDKHQGRWFNRLWTVVSTKTMSNGKHGYSSFLKCE